MYVSLAVNVSVSLAVSVTITTAETTKLLLMTLRHSTDNFKDTRCRHAAKVKGTAIDNNNYQYHTKYNNSDKVRNVARSVELRSRHGTRRRKKRRKKNIYSVNYTPRDKRKQNGKAASWGGG